jgi:acyl-CoA synthetase (AMP-forming)/AMP-acid ligase II
MHVIDLFDWGARNHRDRLAFAGSGGEMTYADAQAATNRIARALLAKGIEPGSPFAVLSPNHTAAMVAMLGALRAGAAWTNVTIHAGAAANIELLRRSGCDILFFHSSGLDVAAAVSEALPGLQTVVCLDSEETPYPSLTAWSEGHSGERLDHAVPTTAIGCRGTTGGTTGTPKVTEGTNAVLYMATFAWATCWQFDAPPVNVAVAPITHAGGMVALAQFQFGGTTVFLDTADTGRLLQTIAERRATTVFLPPTLIYRILDHPDLDRTDLSSLRYVISAGASISAERLTEAVERLGPVVGQAYGQTEAGFPLTWMSPAEIARAARTGDTARLVSCGRPTLICSALEALRDDGTICAPGETGEIVLRGPTVMVGYVDDPAGTAAIQAHGWHHTGDIGHRDADGYVSISDRRRDLIISGGINVFPFEVERALLAHPAVADCAVFGVPDDDWGEAVHAAVELRPEAGADPDGLIAWCKQSIGSKKAPKAVTFVAALPRSPAGKILKRELREPYWAGRGRRIG